MPTHTLELLEKALEGAGLDAAAGTLLLQTTELAPLGLTADARRRQLLSQRTVTYLPGRHIVYARQCNATCPWCHPLVKGSPLGLSAAAAQAAAAVAEGAREITLQGGHPSLPYGYYLGLVRAVREACPGVPLAGFSTAEVLHMARTGGHDVPTVLRDLKQAGLDLFCSAALEPLANQAPAALAALERGEGLDVLRHAAATGLPILAVVRFGVGETPAELAGYLAGLAALSGAVAGVQLWAEGREEEPGEDLLQLEQPAHGGVSGYVYLRTLAVARLMLPGVGHVSASWHSQGAKVAQIALGMGADDLGSLYLDKPHQVELAASVRGPFTVAVAERIASDAQLQLVARPSFAARA